MTMFDDPKLPFSSAPDEPSRHPEHPTEDLADKIVVGEPEPVPGLPGDPMSLAGAAAATAAVALLALLRRIFLRLVVLT